MIPEIYTPEIHEKAWGQELWIRNFEGYCGKILRFNEGAKFSLHFHVLKEETWYIASGEFELIYINTDTAVACSRVLKIGDVIHLKPGVPHQLRAIQSGDVFEVSTQHFPEDSYRIYPGDSQKL